MKDGRGTILYGINNIFTVRVDGETLECRIKGKILRGSQGDYNPLSAGDEAFFRRDEKNPGKGVLIARADRRNALERWNRKGRAPQTIAANLDLVVVVSSPLSPPFRPRFLDRLFVACRFSGIPAVLCLNKSDQSCGGDIEERLGDYSGRNIPIIRTSVPEGRGIEELKNLLRGKRAVFVGHSGVGKTSILNRLVPGLDLRVGKISEKYNRGCHTTVLSHLETWEEGEVIDTPGVREFDIFGIPKEELRFFFDEFKTIAENCAYGGCTHTHEPDCAVRAAAEEGKLLFDRYESYLRIFDDLERREKRSS